MGRTILTIVLLVTMARAQGADRSSGAVATRIGEVRFFRELAGAGPLGIHGTVDFQYDKLRQGTSEYAQVALNSTTRAFWMVGPGGDDSRVEPTRLELEASKDIEISSVSYPASERKRFLFDPKSFRVLKTDGDGPIRFRFKVRASPSVAPGEYVVKAILRYHFVSDAGFSHPQQLRLEVPIKVVDRKTRVVTQDRSIAGIRGITPAEWTEDILLAPLTIPFAIFMAVIGWDGC